MLELLGHFLYFNGKCILDIKSFVVLQQGVCATCNISSLMYWQATWSTAMTYGSTRPTCRTLSTSSSWLSAIQRCASFGSLTEFAMESTA